MWCAATVRAGRTRKYSKRWRPTPRRGLTRSSCTACTSASKWRACWRLCVLKAPLRRKSVDGLTRRCVTATPDIGRRSVLFRDDLKAIADKVRAKVFAACGDGADAVVTVDPTHVGYLCGYRSLLLDVDRNYRCAVIITPDKTLLVTGASDAAPALEIMRDPACVYRYGMFVVHARKAD